jgi:hypothetical protein
MKDILRGLEMLLSVVFVVVALPIAVLYIIHYTARKMAKKAMG